MLPFTMYDVPVYDVTVLLRLFEGKRQNSDFVIVIIIFFQLFWKNNPQAGIGADLYTHNIIVTFLKLLSAIYYYQDLN